MLLRKISSSILSNTCSTIQFYNIKGINPNSLYIKSLASFAIAKQNHINVELSNYIQSDTTIKLLNKKGINNFFPIQAQTFHHITSGKDVIAGDKTGSGKTIAFALPVI
jgi:superfamily II DNA/RNA helicase